MNRTKRVQILKKLIVGTVVTLLLLPTILCVILLIRSNRDLHQIRELQTNVLQYEDRISELEQQLQNEQTGSNRQFDELTSEISKFRNELATYRTDATEESSDQENANWPKKVYLTFDDGPSGHTQDILNVLDRYGVKGNFFVCATQNEDYQKFYRKILDEGHMLGLHSYTHVYEEIYASEDAFREDVLAIREFVKKQTDGYEAVYYRFPGGSDNLHSRISLKSCADWLNEQGLIYYDWNISSQDATNPMQPVENLVHNATYGCENYEEVMILMHDLGNKDSTVEALPKIIEYYQGIGAKISTIDKDSMLIRHDQ